MTAFSVLDAGFSLSSRPKKCLGQAVAGRSCDEMALSQILRFSGECEGEISHV